MKQEISLFNGSIGAYHRGWFGFLFEVSLSDAGEKACSFLFDQFPKIDPEIIIDLLKYLCGAGFLAGADESSVTYDGSRIDHVVSRIICSKDERVFLSDFALLRTSNQVSLEDGLIAVQNFLKINQQLLEEISDFGGLFWEVYPFGIFRCESLLSMIGVKKLTIETYLDQISINLQERKRIFGSSFAFVHRSTGIPIDHDKKRNVFIPKGFYRRIGKILIQDESKDVFLRFSLGDGEGHMGMSLSICLEDPQVGFFKLSYQMIRDGAGNIIPQIVTVQVSPMQIDRQLNFVEGFLPHSKFPNKKVIFQVQEAVSQLLGGGNIFDTMIVALMDYYNSEGFVGFCGIKGSDNLWLRYHADEIIGTEDRAEEIVTDRAEKIYCERFKRLGFLRNNGWWISSDFYRSLSEALSFREIGVKKIKVACRCKGGGEMVKVISLPRWEFCVHEAGMFAVCENLFSDLPQSSVETNLNQLFNQLEVLSQSRRNIRELCCS